MLRSLFGRGRNRREPVAPAPDESIRSARVGDVLTISGYSVEYDERLLFIERIHRYTSPSDTWYELLCVEGDARLWIDWTDGRELSVTVTRTRDHPASPPPASPRTIWSSWTRSTPSTTTWP